MEPDGTYPCYVRVVTGWPETTYGTRRKQLHVQREALAVARILVVEDEYFLASDLQSALHGMGYDVLGPFGQLSAKLDKVVAERPDAAILDINLQGEMAYSVIEKLHALAVPMLLTTGYKRDVLPEHLHDCVIIEKPYSIGRIHAALKAALAAKSALLVEQ